MTRQVLWDKLDRDEPWLSCEFCWHPRILIVANSRAVFLVDLRSDKCKVCTLLKIEAVSLGRTDRFLALSRVESDSFCFTAVSGRFLLLCDVRKPLMPLLQWVHGLNNPAYVTVLRLSDLRVILHKCCIDETPEKVQSCSASAPVLPPFLVALNNLQIAERDMCHDAELRLQSDKGKVLLGRFEVAKTIVTFSLEPLLSLSMSQRIKLIYLEQKPWKRFFYPATTTLFSEAGGECLTLDAGSPDLKHIFKEGNKAADD
ncbi:hypothetical protein HAX54_022610 [Datura stramonium]|uniref:Uncharacterized protein n=1 Tax=Datura stramonium TaxID=4076 RepID=A0ABS8S4H9_DATST|nr:hypothetical protein [Datura stramonium]